MPREEKPETASFAIFTNGIPNGIRTRVTRMRTWCPGPLDDGDPESKQKKITCMVIINAKSGVPTGIRTPVTRMKTWCPRPLDDGDIVYRYGINISHYLKNASAFFKLFDDFLHISEKWGFSSAQNHENNRFCRHNIHSF